MQIEISFNMNKDNKTKLINNIAELHVTEEWAKVVSKPGEKTTYSSIYKMADIDKIKLNK